MENLEGGFQARIFTNMENANHNESKKKPISLKTETVSEPALSYQKETKAKKIIFSTVQDQENENYLYWLSLTPEARIASVTRIIKEIYAEELAKPCSSNRISFD
jgi:hypothetical protein